MGDLERALRHRATLQRLRARGMRGAAVAAAATEVIVAYARDGHTVCVDVGQIVACDAADCYPADMLRNADAGWRLLRSRQRVRLVACCMDRIVYRNIWQCPEAAPAMAWLPTVANDGAPDHQGLSTGWVFYPPPRRRRRVWGAPQQQSQCFALDVFCVLTLLACGSFGRFGAERCPPIGTMMRLVLDRAQGALQLPLLRRLMNRGASAESALCAAELILCAPVLQFADLAACQRRARPT